MAILKFVVYFLTIYIQIASAAVAIDGEPSTKQIGRYVIGEDSVRRIQAKQRCENDGGQLVVIRSEDDIAELTKVLELEPNADVFWIGGLYRDNSKCKGKPFQLDCWYWDDKFYKVYDPSIISFNEEAQNGKPPRSSAMLLKYGEQITLAYDVGVALHPYICDRNPPPHMSEECKAVKVKHVDDQPSRERYLISDDSVRRNEAQSRCIHNGGRLATIQVEKDKRELEALLAPITETRNYWIGGLYKHNRKCRRNPFQADCWYWDEQDGNKKYYNSSLIMFSVNAQVGRPPKSSAMLLQTGHIITLGYSTSVELHTYICDFKPSTPSMIPSPSCIF